MTTAVARSLPAVRPHVETRAKQDGAWPTNLKLLLFVLAGFAVNIALVLYLAAQMPH